MIAPAREFKLEDFRVRTNSFTTDSLSTRVKEGESLSILGPSGSGKSLVLEALAGVGRPGCTPEGERPSLRTALLPQDARLAVLPTDAVFTLLGLNGFKVRLERAFGVRWAPSEEEERIMSLMHSLRLEPERISHLPFRDLSAAERRRVLLSAALLSKPECLLIDGWDEMMDGDDRRAIGRLLAAERQKGLIIIATARRLPLVDFPKSKTIVLGQAMPSFSSPVPLIRKAEVEPRHSHALLEIDRVSVARGRPSLLKRQPPAFPVDGASLYVRHGECLVLLGGSGCGKTTLLETVAGLHSPTHGRILIEAHDVTHASGSRARRLRRDAQMVFQDAPSVLDGNRTVRTHLEEAMSLAREKSGSPAQWLEKLGLSPRLLSAPADQLSLGESQRIDLARSLALSPRLVLLDAPEVSAGDADGGILSSAIAAEKRKGMAFLVATSRMEVAKSLADRIAIMHAGRVVELGRRAEVLDRPAHPLSRALIHGETLRNSNPTAPSVGCPYVGDCPRRKLPLCDEKEPMLAPISPAESNASSSRRRVACFHPLEDE